MIIVTSAAVEKLVSFVEHDGPTYVRMAVTGGGCAGFRYRLDIVDDGPNEFDETTIVYDDGTTSIVMICDQLSMQYLDGMTIDHSSSLMSEGFVFRNPHVKATCGCGQSFDA